jgi:death on curing protein
VSDYIWLDHYDALYVHERLLTLNDGAAGICDNGLLESALARPMQSFNYSENVDIAALAAAYVIGIVKNHPFMDGNKRVGFGMGILFLELNGCRFKANPIDAANTILAVAAGEKSESELADWIRENIIQPI